MTPEELRLAIQQAWEHTQKTSPGPELEAAKRQLAILRNVQASMSADLIRIEHTGPPMERGLGREPERPFISMTKEFYDK